jgi:hypothetical protein
MKQIVTLVASIAFLSSLAYGREIQGKANKFDHVEYMQATSSGQKKAAPAFKGTLFFNTEQKTIEFLDAKGSSALSIKYSSTKSVLYEQTSTPRYAEAVLISPLFVFAHSKKHFLTVQFTNDAGIGEFVIFHLNKGSAREAIATTEAETGKSDERTEEK